MTRFVSHFGGILLLMATLANLAAAAGAHAVFKSVDRGRSWVRSDTGMPGGSRINAFASLDETLFAGTDSGVFISRDEASSWQTATGMASNSNRVIGFATLGPKLFAGTDGHGMWVSSDKGESWVQNARFTPQRVRCLLTHGGKIYAGTDAASVFVSEDGGQSWSQRRQGLPADAQVFALSVVAGRLFAGLYSKGLYAWNEPEHRWRKTGPVSPLVLAAVDGTLIAGHNPGGLYWSTDLGASWSKGTAAAGGDFSWLLADEAGELSSEAAVWELASDGALVFAGASTGIYYSEDSGRSWTRARAGLPDESPGVAFLLRRGLVLAGTTINRARFESGGAATGKVQRRLPSNPPP